MLQRFAVAPARIPLIVSKQARAVQRSLGAVAIVRVLSLLLSVGARGGLSVSGIVVDLNPERRNAE
jgi:hypothetical protein